MKNRLKYRQRFTMSRPPARVGLPALTKTERLRQTRSAALMREYEQRQEAAAAPPRPPEPVRRRRPAPPPGRRVEFTRPAMTKAMMARVKHAEEVKREFARREEETRVPERRIPRRTPAPIGGDPRRGRERIRRPSPPRVRRVPTSTPRRPPPIPERTKQLARSMQAEVIQAEPIGEGPIDSIVIPPKTVSEDRTTIVSIPQPPTDPSSQIASRSIQVISDALDEQDAAETVTVQGKLDDLQQARRDFVLTVAHVGGNAVQLVEEERLPYLPGKTIYRVPDIESELLRVECGRDHPSVVAAREFAQRSMARLRAEEARRAAQEIERIAAEPFEELDFDMPFEEDFFREADISWEEEEDVPRPSRVRAIVRDLPVREEAYPYSPFEPEQLERFFDIERYPPTPTRVAEVEPWPTCPACAEDISDLIQFSPAREVSDLIQFSPAREMSDLIQFSPIREPPDLIQFSP